MGLIDAFRSRGAPVLVIGAAHIDVMADFRSALDGRVDKAGEVRYSVGGTAYNIAVNLGQDSVPVAIVCVLKQNSFSSVWIRERLIRANVGSEYVELSPSIAESGFVGLRRDGKLASAVTASAVENHTFDIERLRSATDQAAIVVAECNLDVVQLGNVIALAQAKGKPVAVAAVSDTKIERLLRLRPDRDLDLVIMNQAELDATGLALDTSDPASVALVCRALHTRCAVVTRAAAGHVALDADGRVQTFAAVAPSTIASSSGAGDALLAGILAHWQRNGRLDVAGADDHAMELVQKVLRQPAATAGALAVDADFAQLARIAVQEAPLWRRMLSQEVGVAAALIALIPLVYAAFQWLMVPATAVAVPAPQQGVPASTSAGSSAPARRPGP